MRISISSLACAPFILGLAVLSSSAGDDKRAIKPTQHWNGTVEDKEKRAEAPKTGMLTSQAAFEKLWEAWAFKGKAPKLDFAKQIVFVQTGAGPNVVTTTYSLDKNGDLKARPIQTLTAGPGFGYGIDVLDRAGIKTYMGKPIK